MTYEETAGPWPFLARLAMAKGGSHGRHSRGYSPIDDLERVSSSASAARPTQRHLGFSGAVAGFGTNPARVPLGGGRCSLADSGVGGPGASPTATAPRRSPAPAQCSAASLRAKRRPGRPTNATLAPTLRGECAFTRE